MAWSLNGAGRHEADGGFETKGGRWRGMEGDEKKGRIITTGEAQLRAINTRLGPRKLMVIRHAGSGLVSGRHLHIGIAGSGSLTAQ